MTTQTQHKIAVSWETLTDKVYTLSSPEGYYVTFIVLQGAKAGDIAVYKNDGKQLYAESADGIMSMELCTELWKFYCGDCKWKQVANPFLFHNTKALHV